MKKLALLMTILTSVMFAGCSKMGGNDSGEGAGTGKMVAFYIDDTIVNPTSKEAIAAYKGLLTEAADIISDMNNLYYSRINYVVNAVDAVVRKYDNGYLSGTVTLQCTEKVNGSHTLKKWTLTAKK